MEVIYIVVGGTVLLILCGMVILLFIEVDRQRQAHLEAHKRSAGGDREETC